MADIRSGWKILDGLTQGLNSPFSIFDFLPSEDEWRFAKETRDEQAKEKYGNDPNPVRRLPFNALTQFGFNPQIAAAVPTGIDYAPALGEASAVADALIAYNKGDLATAGLLGAAALFPLAPKGQIRKGAKKIKGLLDDIEVKVDPATLGSNFGNISIGRKSDPISPVMKYEDVPVVDPRDYIGAKIQPTSADLLDAGRYYKGIDSSLIDEPEPLKGGVMYPLQENENKAGFIWADKESTANKKIESDADLIGVATMNPDSHRSNFTSAQNITKTLMAYIRDGRMSVQDVGKLDDLVREASTHVMGDSKKGAQKLYTKLKDFPSFMHPDLPDYLESVGFEYKKKIAEIINSKAAKKLNVPNVDKIVDATVDRQFAGMNPRDTVLLLRPDKAKELQELKREGLLAHPSYDRGILGAVEGRFENPVSMDIMYSNYFANRRAMGAPESGDIRSFDLKKPIEEMTDEKASNILRATGYKFIDQPRQALVMYDTMTNSWRTNLTAKNKGGMAPTEYEDAIKRNPSSPSLTKYTAKDITSGAKNGNLTTYQLGDKQIFFGIDNKPDYSWMGDIPELGDNEKALVGVVSNEIGAKGVAAPSVVLKAIEEGVTILDAFAVKSAKHPEGYLTQTYGDYGFKEIKRVPFDKDIYLEEHSINEYNDLIKNWKDEGWTEDRGFPDVVLMKFTGDDNARPNATNNFFRESNFSFGSGEAGQSTATARQLIGQGVPENAGQGTERFISSNRGGNTGTLRADNRGSLSNRSQRVAQGLLSLTPEQAQNIGIDPDGLLNLVGK